MTAAACAVLLSASLLFAVPAPAAGGTTHAKGKTAKGKSTKKKTSSRSRRGRHSWRSRGQKTIDQARAREIQQALIREGYLSGSANGQWDARSREAMARYQADHGWQTKTVPDARALIKLGLGPATAGEASPAESPAAPATAPAGGQKGPADTRQD